jgi:subtilase family serine protease
VTFEVTAPPRADLTVDSITPDAGTSVTKGDNFDFSYAIKNAGAAAAGANWAGFMIDQQPDASHYVGFGMVNELSVGGTQILHGSIATSGLTAGTHTLHVAADYWGNQVAEGNEANNALSITFTVIDPFA